LDSFFLILQVLTKTNEVGQTFPESSRKHDRTRHRSRWCRNHPDRNEETSTNQDGNWKSGQKGTREWHKDRVLPVCHQKHQR
jgi:hypothetical protein